MFVGAAMEPLTKGDASAPTVAQPASINSIYKGAGGHNYSSGRAPHLQEGREHADNAVYAIRGLIQEQLYPLLQALLQKFVDDRVGRGLFQEIFE